MGAAARHEGLGRFALRVLWRLRRLVAQVGLAVIGGLLLARFLTGGEVASLCAVVSGVHAHAHSSRSSSAGRTGTDGTCDRAGTLAAGFLRRGVGSGWLRTVGLLTVRVLLSRLRREVLARLAVLVLLICHARLAVLILRRLLHSLLRLLAVRGLLHGLLSVLVSLSGCTLNRLALFSGWGDRGHRSFGLAHCGSSRRTETSLRASAGDRTCLGVGRHLGTGSELLREERHLREDAREERDEGAEEGEVGAHVPGSHGVRGQRDLDHAGGEGHRGEHRDELVWAQRSDALRETADSLVEQGEHTDDEEQQRPHEQHRPAVPRADEEGVRAAQVAVREITIERHDEGDESEQSAHEKQDVAQRQRPEECAAWLRRRLLLRVACGPESGLRLAAIRRLLNLGLLAAVRLALAAELLRLAAIRRLLGLGMAAIRRLLNLGLLASIRLTLAAVLLGLLASIRLTLAAVLLGLLAAVLLLRRLTAVCRRHRLLVRLLTARLVGSAHNRKFSSVVVTWRCGRASGPQAPADLWSRPTPRRASLHVHMSLASLPITPHADASCDGFRPFCTDFPHCDPLRPAGLTGQKNGCKVHHRDR